MPAMKPTTPTLDLFLREISNLLRNEDGVTLQQYLKIEPPYGQQYDTLIQELRQAYPQTRQDLLEQHCSSLLPEARDGIELHTPWSAFIKFLTLYFAFLREGHDAGNLLGTYNALSEVVQ